MRPTKALRNAFVKRRSVCYRQRLIQWEAYRRVRRVTYRSLRKRDTDQPGTTWFEPRAILGAMFDRDSINASGSLSAESRMALAGARLPETVISGRL